MNPDVWRQIEELYEAASKASPDERRALLQRADPQLRAKVESMLAQESSALDHPAWQGASELFGTTAAGAPTIRHLGPYEIEQLLGEGGMGRVYRARDTRLGRKVAVKLLSSKLAAEELFRRRFLHEARAASALNHPNVVVLHDIASHDGTDFLVMEYVEGRMLNDMIPPGGMVFEQLAALGSQVALALGAAHAAGIVHRDIKPANIVVTAEQQVKVLDFGIARLPRSVSGTNLTRHGEIVGTVAYMSPEQTRGEEVDARSDIFSLGTVLYEAATGHPPFRGDSAIALMHQIETAEPAAPDTFRSGLPPEFIRLVMRCLAKRPSARPDSAVELATQLKALSLPPKPQTIIRSGQPSLAVLPLQIRGPASDQYLSVSLADALIHRLSSSGKLAVRPIASVTRYAGHDVDWNDVARDLNTDFVVEGVIQVMGTKIRVLAQAHRVSDSQTVASVKVDGDTDDLFALQDKLTDTIDAVFLPQRKAAEPAVAPTANPAAYELYLRAVDRQVHVDRFEMASAIEMLTRAAELDPGFADAWGLLAQACAQMGAHLDRDPKWFEMSERAGKRALELDPVQCEALCAHSMVIWSPSRNFQNRAALRALNAALKIAPLRTTARHQRCAVLWHLGFLEAALADAEELQSPMLSVTHKANIAWQRGDLDESAALFTRAFSIEPNNVLNHLMAPVAYLWSGKTDEARRLIERARSIVPSESFIVGADAVVAALDGDLARAESLADEARVGQSLTHTHHTWHYCAAAYALCGKNQQAIAELRRCADLGLPNHRMFDGDPFLRSLHRDPEFQRLMSKLRREHLSIAEEFGLKTSISSARAAV